MASERKARTRTLYIHTIDGKPGHWDGEQIAFADELPHWQDEPAPAQAFRQLSTIRRHIKASTAFRRALKWDVPKYGWVVVEVPRG